jgi:hypothetical protein
MDDDEFLREVSSLLIPHQFCNFTGNLLEPLRGGASPCSASKGTVAATPIELHF